MFIQPPLSFPAMPSLPLNTRYLPLLLPSVSDVFASSILDLSPSVLFDHSVPNISSPDNTSRKLFAFKQCEELDILCRQLGETEEILTVDEFVGIRVDRMSRDLRHFLCPPGEISKEAREDDVLGTMDAQRGLGMFRKHVVYVAISACAVTQPNFSFLSSFVSAFFVALLFGLAVFLRGNPFAPSDQPATQDQKVWSFLHPFVSRTPPALRTVSAPLPASPELPRSHPLSPASLKSFAVSVFRSRLTADEVAGTSTSVPSHPDNRDNEARQNSATQMADGQVRLATSDAAASPLTLDAPSKRSVSPISPARDSSAWMGKGKDEAVYASSLSTSVTSLATRLSRAVSPFFEAISNDLQELEVAIDALLHALLQLIGEASQGIGELVHVMSRQMGHGAEGFTGKIHRAAQSVGEKASKRHARARQNARKVRDVGERYVNAAKKRLEWGIERARGNAKEVLIEGLAMGRRESRKLRRQAREQRKIARTAAWQKRKESQHRMRGTDLIFNSVMALVA